MDSKSKRGKVVILEDSSAWGGVERWILSLAQGLRDYGYDIAIATPLNGELGRRACKLAIEVFPIELIGHLKIFNPFTLYKFSSYLKRNKVKVLFLNGSKEFKFGGLSAYLAKTKKVIYRRGSDLPIPNKFYNRFLMKNVVSLIVVNSQASRNSILREGRKWLDEGRTQVIYNGVDLNVFTPEGEIAQIRKEHNIPDNHIIIGCIGRLTEQKGYEYTFEAISRVYKDVKNFSVFIVGKGELKHKFQKLIKERGLDKTVFFLEFRKDIPEILRATDFLLHTPLWEGAPNVILEAMACSKPVVTWKVSGIPELIVDEETGYLCENGDIDGVSLKIREMIENVHNLKAKEMGKNARKRAEMMFSGERMMKEYLKIIN